MRGKRFGIVAAVGAALFLLLELAGVGIESLSHGRPEEGRGPGETASAAGANARAVRALQYRLSAFAPGGLYIVVDTAANRLFLRKGDSVVREIVVSCGSGDILDEPGGTRRWTFDTPRGAFTVQSKLVNPTWIKPDWAFIEEGEKVPARYDARIDNDSLGDYALGFGDGFFIHGTLYTRLLGRNVTHGCIRVGDKDLKSLFQAVERGTPVFIY